MHVLLTQCHISQSDLVPKIGYFAWNWRAVLVETYTMMTKRGSNTLSEALTIIPVHLNEVMNHSSSNISMSLWLNIIFPCLIWCQESGDFAWNLRAVLVRNKHRDDHKGIKYAVRGTEHHSYASDGGNEPFKQQWIHFLMTKRCISWADLMSKIGYLHANCE